MKRILAIEACQRNMEHVAINTALLSVVSQIFTDYSIHFWAEKKHLRHISKKIRINPHSIRFIPYRLFLLPFFDLLASFNVLYVLFISRKNDVILITNRLPLTHIIFNFFNLFFRRQAIITLHGEMEAFVNPSRMGKTRYYFKLHRIAFRLKNKKTRYLILGEPIKKAILNHIPLKPANIICIDHPIDYDTSPPHYNNSKSTLSFGFVGRAVLEKNAQKIFQLADMLRDLVEQKKIRLEIIGSINSDVKSYANNLVEYANTSQMIDQKVYVDKIANLDYILCFLDESSYKAIPSGTFFDAINYEKPLLALKGNSFIDHYFSKYEGIGHLCDGIEDMAMLLKKLCSNMDMAQQHYHSLVNHLKNAKKELSLPNIAASFRSQYYHE